MRRPLAFFRTPAFLRAIAPALLLAACVWPAHSQTRIADPSYRDAELALRAATRDTAGHGADAARLDTLGVALLRLARFDEATQVFDRVIALDPDDATANAGRGKLALFRDALDDAETALARAYARDRDPATARDLYATRLRAGHWARAAELAEAAGEPGRRELLEAMAGTPPCVITAGPDEDHLPFVVRYPVPCVRAHLGAASVLLAIDTGARGLLLDTHQAHAAGLRVYPQQTPTEWLGRTQAVTEASAPTLELGRFTLTNVPVGLLDLRKYGLTLNPRSEPVVGVIGMQVLRAFVPTLDYRRGELVLRRVEHPAPRPTKAIAVPFELRGETPLVVRGALAGGRAMSLEVATGMPECGVAAGAEVFGEVGLKAGSVASAMGSASSWMQGRTWARVTVPSVVVGGVVQNGVPGWSMREGSDELWRDAVRSDGYLSNDFFRGWRVTFDWAARQMVFEPRE